ncbi:hypothetical protein HPP92_028708 [Vanilla planifolia]|uniref:Uncharacterized protein n=1 Tax=Vanilla planifolia TaxID=51239 RepID=A0A835U387_VANPL|nr:hypothetical protein HPP92_028708 [Vanilla planifolia]
MRVERLSIDWFLIGFHEEIAFCLEGKALPSVSLPRLNKNSKNSETGCDPDGEEEGVREKGRDQLGKLYWWRLIFNWLLGISR